MPMKAVAAVMAFVAGQPMNVRQVCGEVGICRQTFYKYAARCRAERLAGFEPRSRRPHSCPRAVSGVVEDAVISWRKQLADAGLLFAIGVLKDAVAGNDYCNGTIVSSQVAHTTACLCDCLHVDDLAAILKEKGLDKRPEGK